MGQGGGSLPVQAAAGKAGPDGLQESAGARKRDAPMLAVVLFAGCKGSRLRPPNYVLDGPS